MKRTAIDIVGPLPVTKNGNKYCLVVSCYFTKWVQCIPLKDQTAETLAKAFVEHVVCRLGAFIFCTRIKGPAS